MRTPELSRSHSVEGRVLEEGMTVREALRQGGSAEGRLRRKRAAYLAQARPPQVRIDFYLHGPDSFACEALGRALASVLAARCGDRHYTALGRNFNDYDGESVILWPNTDPLKMLHTFEAFDDDNCFNKLFAALNVLPEPSSIMTAHGCSQLVHQYLVMTGTRPPSDFRGILKQVYSKCSDNAAVDSSAHLPIIIRVDTEAFDVQVSSVFLGGNDQPPFDRYVTLERVRNRLREALRRVGALPDEGDREAAEYELMSRQVRAITAASDLVRAGLIGPTSTVEELLAGFDGLGDAIPE